MVEYSELDPSVASAVNQETGRLRFCWSNVRLIFAYLWTVFVSLALCSNIMCFMAIGNLHDILHSTEV